MAIVKFTNSKGSVRFILKYVMDRNKTDERLISGMDCIPENVFAEMQNVKLTYNKTDGRQYVHIVQSFHPDEDLTAEKTHEIGLKFAESFMGFQAVVVTHHLYTKDPPYSIAQQAKNGRDNEQFDSQ